MADPIYELKKLEETGGIKEYYEAFDSIQRSIDLPEEFLRSWFVAGLRRDTRREVRSFRPQTVIQAYAYGRLYEIAYPKVEESSKKTEIPSQQMQQIVTNLNSNKQFRALPQQYMHDSHLSCEGHQHPLELMQKDTEDSVKMEDIVKAQEHKLEQMADLVETLSPKDRSPIAASDLEIRICVAKSGGELKEPPKMSNMVTFSQENPMTSYHGINSIQSSKGIFEQDPSHIVEESGIPRSRSVNSLKEPRLSLERIVDAHQVLDEMPIRDFKGSDSSIQLNKAHRFMGNWIFDPGDFIDKLEITSSSQEVVAEPFADEFSMELISSSNRRLDFDAETIDTCHDSYESVADFGNFSKGLLEIHSAYQMLGVMLEPSNSDRLPFSHLKEEQNQESIVVKEPTDLIAYQVFDEMPQQDPKQVGLKAFEVSDPKDVTLLLVVGTAFIGLAKDVKIYYAMRMCFDPGGKLNCVGDSLKLGLLALSCDENRKLLGSMGCSYFGSQQFTFDPGITFEQDDLKTREMLPFDPGREGILLGDSTLGLQGTSVRSVGMLNLVVSNPLVTDVRHNNLASLRYQFKVCFRVQSLMFFDHGGKYSLIAGLMLLIQHSDDQGVLMLRLRLQRLQILKLYTRKIRLDPNVDLRTIASSCNGYVGADLEALCREAATSSIKRALETTGDADLWSIMLDDWESAKLVVSPSITRGVTVEIPRVSWEDIGGLHELKKKLKQAVEWHIKHFDAFSRLGISPVRGILLHGPPGCSKTTTTLVKAAAHAAQASFFSLSGADFNSKYVGDGEALLRNTFRRARIAAPSILFFDEADNIGGKRGGSSSGNFTGERLLSTSLTEDGWHKRLG